MIFMQLLWSVALSSPCRRHNPSYVKSNNSSLWEGSRILIWEALVLSSWTVDGLVAHLHQILLVLPLIGSKGSANKNMLLKKAEKVKKKKAKIKIAFFTKYFCDWYESISEIYFFCGKFYGHRKNTPTEKKELQPPFSVFLCFLEKVKYALFILCWERVWCESWVCFVVYGVE